MAGNERRTSSRKACALPVRFRVTANGHKEQEQENDEDREMSGSSGLTPGPEFVGKALNVTERGLYFTCKENLKIGQPLEMFLTLPQEITGGAAENVRCSARVVHVDEDGPSGMRGIGACVERLEAAAALPHWAN